MAGCGAPHEMISERLGIAPKTLRRAFRKELDAGHEQANALVAQTLFKKATGSGPQSVTAAIFWLKTRAGWKETQVTELTGRGGAPILPPTLAFKISFPNGGPGG